MITIRGRVRFNETDTMGVVYHPNYLHWFDFDSGWNWFLFLFGKNESG